MKLISHIIEKIQPTHSFSLCNGLQAFITTTNTRQLDISQQLATLDAWFERAERHNPAVQQIGTVLSTECQQRMCGRYYDAIQSLAADDSYGLSNALSELHAFAIHLTPEQAISCLQRCQTPERIKTQSAFESTLFIQLIMQSLPGMQQDDVISLLPTYAELLRSPHYHARTVAVAFFNQMIKLELCSKDEVLQSLGNEPPVSVSEACLRFKLGSLATTPSISLAHEQ